MIWLWNLENITNNAQRESITRYSIDGCQDLINIYTWYIYDPIAYIH